MFARLRQCLWAWRSSSFCISSARDGREAGGPVWGYLLAPAKTDRAGRNVHSQDARARAVVPIADISFTIVFWAHTASGVFPLGDDVGLSWSWNFSRIRGLGPERFHKMQCRPPAADSKEWRFAVQMFWFSFCLGFDPVGFQAQEA